jgi:hypothetical protein
MSKVYDEAAQTFVDRTTYTDAVNFWFLNHRHLIDMDALSVSVGQVPPKTTEEPIICLQVKSSISYS